MDVLDIANVARVQCQAIRQEDSRTDEVFMVQSPLPLTSKRRSIRKRNSMLRAVAGIDGSMSHFEILPRIGKEPRV